MENKMTQTTDATTTKQETIEPPDDIKVIVHALPMEWKCLRCRQHKTECPSNYNLCYRCQNYMHHAINSRCVSCGNDQAVDNLCDECRNARIAAYDKTFIENLKKDRLREGQP